MTVQHTVSHGWLALCFSQHCHRVQPPPLLSSASLHTCPTPDLFPYSSSTRPCRFSHQRTCTLTNSLALRTMYLPISSPLHQLHRPPDHCARPPAAGPPSSSL
ncbi:hypothetical protein VTO73DRAFT_2489 [Trametes versicolor]